MPNNQKAKTILIYLEDCIDSINKILSYTTKMKFREFEEDEKTVDAVVRNFEVIGEALNRASKLSRKELENLPLEEIVGMRNKMIHEYSGIDISILWKTIKEDVPLLKKELTKIIKKNDFGSR